MRYLLKITYDGSNFNGYQIQPNCHTIQQVLQTALAIILKEDVVCVASGRTDAGVHAIRQYVHFDTNNTKVSVDKIERSLNGLLPDDVRVLECKESDINARFDPKQKTYVYKMYAFKTDLPLENNKSLNIKKELRINLLKKGCKYLMGKHDFKNFCASGSSVLTTVRNVFDCSIKKHTKYENVVFYTFEVTGDGFLYKMVRNIVGLLIEFGQKKISWKEFKQFAFGISTKRFTVAPYGLYLYDVKY